MDGTFTDDVTGVPAEHDALPGRLGLTPAQVASYQYDTSIASQQIIDAAIASNKYVWAAFGHQDGVGSGPNAATCATWMRARCNSAYQAQAITQTCDAAHFNQSLAAFLITRPPIAFFGFGWESDQRNWRSEFLWDVGTPQGLCTETEENVFSRAWTHGAAVLNCSSYEAVVPAV